MILIIDAAKLKLYIHVFVCDCFGKVFYLITPCNNMKRLIAYLERIEFL